MGEDFFGDGVHALHNANLPGCFFCAKSVQWPQHTREDKVVGMLQDIAPHVYDNQYHPHDPEPLDRVLVVKDNAVLVLNIADDFAVCQSPTLLPYPTVADVDAVLNQQGIQPDYQYLFSIDDVSYYLPTRDALTMARIASLLESADFMSLSHATNLSRKNAADYLQDDIKASSAPSSSTRWVKAAEIHAQEHGSEAFAGLMGLQLWNWYDTTRFCGRCGEELVPDEHERMMRCPRCANLIYPRINPAVIVGIIDPVRDKVVVARGVGRPLTSRSLIAGFAESGETIEQTVHREVKEEVGLDVTNLRFYKSQPWPLSSSLLMGFFCDLDGSNEISVQEEELAFAEWVDRDELPIDDTNYSLTREMMEVLRTRKEAL